MRTYRLPRHVLAAYLLLLSFLTLGGVALGFLGLRRRPGWLMAAGLAAFLAVIRLAWTKALTDFVILVTVLEEDRIEFKSIRGRKLLCLREIQGIILFPTPRYSDDSTRMQIESSQGRIDIHERMEGVEDLICFLKAKNLKVTVSGQRPQP